MNEFFTLMKSEMLVTIIIFILLFIKIGRGISNERLLPIIQFLSLGNFIAGFFLNENGSLFDGMFYTNGLIVLQKNDLNFYYKIMNQ